MMNEQPLVSVIVITYNSAKTVLETLDSITQQTYKKLELIVTDDGSTDGTVDIVKKWMSLHEKEFVDSKLLTVEKNTGTASNCNRGFFAAKGSWIKAMAGDDLFMPNCISQLLQYTSEFPNVDIFFSKVKGFNQNGVVDDSKLPFKYSPFSLNKEDFLIYLTLGNFIPAAGYFIKTECFKSLGGYDENIKLMEDWPFWIKAAYNKKNMMLIDEALVLYRVSESSISLAPTLSKAYIDSIIQAQRYVSSIRLKISFWLWLWKKCDAFGRHRIRILRIIQCLNLFNPMTYRIKRIYKSCKP